MAQCEGVDLTSLVVRINDKIYDIRKRNVTVRSGIWTTNMRSLGFQDIREWVTLWGLILRSLGCIALPALQGSTWELGVPWVKSNTRICSCPKDLVIRLFMCLLIDAKERWRIHSAPTYTENWLLITVFVEF